MKLLFENWRLYLHEVSDIPKNIALDIKKSIENSNFWTKPHSESDVDLVEDDVFSTPAIEVLMDTLNSKAEELNTDLYFYLSVTDDEQYTLDEDEPYGNYPNNWLMRGQYRGPERGKHIIWLEFRPISDDFNIKDLNPAELVKKISLTINHELVHYSQLKKQAKNKGISEEEAWEQLLDDPSQISRTGKRKDYLSRHIEVDAYAYEAAEELLSQYSPEQALELIKSKDSKVAGVIKDYRTVFADDPKMLQRFLKRVYTQIMKQKN